MTGRIGTRGSRLALWQANHVRQLLEDRFGWKMEIVVVKTSGDQFPEAAVGNLGTKGVFIKELEEALLDGRADIAVHSMKDVPTELDSRFSFPAVLRREDPRDCLVSRSGARLDELPSGARVGTSSVRRQAQLRHYRPDLTLVPLRGNVDTRLAKLEGGDFDAIVVAKAGLDRLDFSSRITEAIDPAILLPAVAQGAIGLETRAGDPAFCKTVSALTDIDTRSAVNAERALLAELEGGCQVPVGALARWEESRFVMDACVASPDGKEYVRLSAEAGEEEMKDKRTPLTLGRELAGRLLDSGAARILRIVGRDR
ncbi:MAG TPA: hydroxymethylbilane synthase [Candidatus Dormibacteraeota bacterium]|nr:hydroxymethylbilane synthase [Candidatus Dormibacteraeota bacterium]